MTYASLIGPVETRLARLQCRNWARLQPYFLGKENRGMITNGTGRLPMHELATLFPPMSAEEFTALKDDIALHGIHQPVAVWRGSVIDGRNRYLAAEELGVEAPLRYLDDDVDPVGFVLSANMNRRNLSASQRAIVMASLPKLSWGRTKSESKPAKAGLLSTAATRAERAAINESLQGKADVIHSYGDENLIAQIRQGTLMVDDAHKGIRESVKAKRAAEKAEQDRRATEKALALAQANRLSALQAERIAIEKARANRLAAEKAELESIEKAKAEQEVALQAELEAIEKAQAEREVAEREARAQRALADAAEREAAGKTHAEREAKGAGSSSRECGNRCRPAGDHREGQGGAGSWFTGSRPATDGRRPHIDQIGLRCKGTTA